MNESSSFMNVIFNYCSPNLWKCSSQQCGRIRPAGGSSATGYRPLSGWRRGGACWSGSTPLHYARGTVVGHYTSCPPIRNVITPCMCYAPVAHACVTFSID